MGTGEPSSSSPSTQLCDQRGTSATGGRGPEAAATQRRRDQGDTDRFSECLDSIILSGCSRWAVRLRTEGVALSDQCKPLLSSDESTREYVLEIITKAVDDYPELQDRVMDMALAFAKIGE